MLWYNVSYSATSAGSYYYRYYLYSKIAFCTWYRVFQYFRVVLLLMQSWHKMARMSQEKRAMVCQWFILVRVSACADSMFIQVRFKIFQKKSTYFRSVSIYPNHKISSVFQFPVKILPVKSLKK